MLPEVEQAVMVAREQGNDKARDAAAEGLSGFDLLASVVLH